MIVAIKRWLVIARWKSEKQIKQVEEQDDPKIVAALVYLPKQYNPEDGGGPIEKIKFFRTAKAISRHFEKTGQGGGTIHWDPKTGFWAKQGYVYVDDVILLQVDIVDVPKHRKWLKAYCEVVLKRRFKQKAILVEFIPIKVLLV